MTLLHITTISHTLAFLRRQMQFMRENGWTVHACASPGKYESTLHGIPFHAVEMSRRITPFRDLVAIARLWKQIRRIRPTIVHAHTPKAGLLGMMAATLARAPVRVFHVHGLPHLTAHGWRRRLLVLATRVACALAHKVFCISPSIRRILVDQHLCHPRRVVVPANGSSGGVDALERFNPDKISALAVNAVRAKYDVPSHALVAAFVGRLVRDKGLVELSEAWKVLRSRHPELYLLLAGDFEPQDPVPADVVQALRSDPRVRFTGFCTNMPELFAAIDLLVFPTYREGFGNVLLEAGAMRVPVVATSIPGCVDAVEDGITGILVAPHDSGALADAVERYIEDPELRRRHGVCGRERTLRDFRAEPIWEFIFEEYGQLLNRRGIRHPVPRGLSCPNDCSTLP